MMKKMKHKEYSLRHIKAYSIHFTPKPHVLSALEGNLGYTLSIHWYTLNCMSVYTNCIPKCIPKTIVNILNINILYH